MCNCMIYVFFLTLITYEYNFNDMLIFFVFLQMLDNYEHIFAYKYVVAH